MLADQMSILKLVILYSPPNSLSGTLPVASTCGHGDHQEVDTGPVGHRNRARKVRKVARVFKLKYGKKLQDAFRCI